MIIINAVSSAFELLLVFLASCLVYLYIQYRLSFNYWKKKNVPYFPPTFPIGNLSRAALGLESIYLRLQKLHMDFKNLGHKYGGIYFFNGPLYMPVHPDLVKSVLVSDFDKFTDRGMYCNPEKIPLSSHIFSMSGEKWKEIRTKMSPVFTTGKMKSMYNILVKKMENLVDFLTPIGENHEIVDIKDVLMRLTTDIIGATAFGVESNSLMNPDGEFSRMVRGIFNQPSWKLGKIAFEEGLQNPGNIIKIASDNPRLSKYFTDLVQSTVEYRDKNNIQRDDFFDMLMKMRDSAGLTVQEMAAQSFLFFTAGYETSSSTMSYCIHELMWNQELQDEIRHEIQETLGHDSSTYTYDGVMNLPLLDRAVKETLRKYPPVGMLNRVCVKPYKIPGTDTVIDPGTLVIISLLGLHRDEEYFEDPMKFDPERFNGKDKIKNFTYLPFGDGPRNCLGLRFGYMQTKLGLATLLNNFKFTPTEKTARELKIDPSSTVIVLSVLGGIHTRIEKL